MRNIIVLVLCLLFSTSAFSQPLKNKEFGRMAVNAATAINTINWGYSVEDKFEVISEKYTEDDANTYGTYKVRLFRVDKKNSKEYDSGKDFDVYIIDGAVLSVTVDCRMCS